MRKRQGDLKDEMSELYRKFLLLRIMSLMVFCAAVRGPMGYFHVRS